MNDEQQRGRSPSAGHHAHLTHSASTSPHPQASFDNSYQHQQFFANSDSTFSPQFNSTFQPDQYLNPQATLLDYNQQFQTTGQSIDITQQNYFQTQVTNGAYLQQNENLSPGSSSSNLNVPSPYSVSSESTSFPNFDLDLSGQALDPSLLYAQQQQQQQQQQQKQQQQQQQQGFDSSSSLSLDPMAATQQNPTPPHLLQAGLRRSSQSPSPHTSPSFQQTSFNDQGSRPRSESLDPSSAAYPPPGYHGNDWATGRAFQTHRRSPSDTYSEISSHSAQASPFLEPSDGFDVSPMLHGQDPVLFPDALGLGQFTLSDPQLAQSQLSPAHSPHMSPNLMPQPQQSVPEYIPLSNFGYSPDMPGQNVPTFDLFQNNAPEPFPQLSASNSPGDFGQADIMSPPEINIELAPPSRQLSFGPPPAASQDDTLSPPERNQSRNRERAKSDSFASGNSRPSTPSFSGRGRSPSLQPFKDGSGKDSLSPHDIRLPTSRSPSPSVSSVSGNRSRTSSMSSVPQRDYILDLANPDRSTSNGHDPKRVQKHPANFQCTLCPKKFTRAYNLRSHLRTHTDERPFVCTVCGKAFARQHDRKRHEGLHSGEKKFVCKGALSAGEQWGCGRRFARADALGRHFRSEAGRVCIKPLLDEEAAERQRQWQDNQAQQQMQNAQGFVSQAPMMQPQLHPILPAALLQTYPELAQIDWSLPSAPMADDPMDAYSGRSSFDASSGGEWDMSENEMGPYGSNQQANGGAQQQSMGLHNGMGNGWGGQPDYLSDFEGR